MWKARVHAGSRSAATFKAPTRSERRSSKSGWRILVAVIATAAAVVPGHASETLLRAVVDSIEENARALETWQGAAHVQQEFYADGVVEQAGSGAVSFAYSAEENAAAFWWTDLSNDATTPSEQGYYINGIIRSDSLLLYSEQPPHGFPVTGKMMSIKEARYSEDLYWDRVFDPKCGFARRSRDHAGFLRFVLDDPKALEHWSTTRDGSLVTIEYVSSDPNYQLVSRYTADMDQGGQIVAFLGSDPQAEERWDYEFEEIHGVWVPVSMVAQMFNGTRKDRILSGRRKVQWTKSLLNEPLPDGTFEPSGIGVPIGATVSDSILDLRYKYGASDVDLSNIEMGEETGAGTLNSSKGDTGGAERVSQPVDKASLPPTPTDPAASVLVWCLVVTLALFFVWLLKRVVIQKRG
jgi:hypothetical protein